MEGVVALALLILLQFAITWLSVRSPRFSRLIKSEPTLLLRKGKFVDRAMKAQRVTRGEVLAAVRASGTGDLGSIAFVVLETDGSFSVIPERQGAGPEGAASALEDVQNGTPEAVAGR